MGFATRLRTEDVKPQNRPSGPLQVDRLKATFAKGRGRGEDFEVDLAKLSDEELVAIASGKANLVMNRKAYSGLTPADV
jgi:hypothetical protein